MAFKGDDSTLSLATTVTLALAVAAMVFTKNPLQSSRPPGMGTGLHQTTEELKVPARLWEDPFTAVERASDANKQFSVLAIDRRSMELGTMAVSPQSPRIAGLDSLHRRIRDIDALGERILTLVVMTQDGSSVEAVENRIRDRYAVAAALEVGCFAPEKDEWLSYFTWNYHIPSRNPANESKLLPQSTPYEWYSRSPIGLCHGSNELFEEIRHVLVLWVKAEEDEGTTLTRIDSLLYWIKPSGAMATKLVGPRSSADFRAILKEIERTASSSEGARAHYRWQDDNGTLEFYSPWATAMPGLLSYLSGLEGVNDKRDCRSYVACKQVFEGLLTAAGLVLSYRVTSDDVLLESLVKELHRRQVAIEHDRIALIGEWDSFYARALPLTFAAAACQYVGKCPSLEEGIDDLLAGKRSLGEFNILQYSYLSGLDGDASDDRARRSKVKEGSKEKDKEKAEGKERFRDIDSYERPEGQAQLDYVRRLVARIKAESQDSGSAGDRSTEAKRGQLKAIGILGRDTYDALLILQAVREQFPNTLFFATDLDARYFHEDEQKWTRNLIVVSQFGLQLGSSLQQSIPPFRNSLQTSAFFAVLQAIGRITSQGANGLVPPRIFEIGRHGAVDLSLDHPGEGLRRIHPVRTDVDPSTGGLSLPPRIGLLWIVGLVLVFLALWGYGRLWNWLAAQEERNPTQRRLLRIQRGSWILIPVILALVVWCQLLHFPYAEDEPFSWSDGVSIWPTEALRLLSIFLCMVFLIKGHVDSVRNIDELTNSFFYHVARQPKDSGWRNALKGFWGDLNWMFHGSTRDYPGTVSALWTRYRQAHMWLPRAGRITLGLVFYFTLILPLCLFMNGGELRLFVPCRGTFSCSADRVFIGLSVLSFLALNVAVLDAVILCTKWIQEMPAAEGLNEMQQIRLIVERTRIVNRRILYPFLVLFLLIAARSHYFDHWDFPPVLILVLTVNSLVALASASLLYLAAMQAKRRILAPLQQRLDRLAQGPVQAGSAAGEELPDKAWRQIITDIDGIQQGAFVPFYQQPVIQATLVAALAFLQYWYLGQ